MKEIIAFEYDGLYTVEFELDRVLFTPEHTRDGLEFFTWDYDTEADPIVELLRKYAMEALRVSVLDADCRKQYSILWMPKVSTNSTARTASGLSVWTDTSWMITC